MAAPGKENKEKKSGKDESSNAALRKITDDLAALRADIEEIKMRSEPADSARPAKREAAQVVPSGNSADISGHLQTLLAEPTDAAISMAYSYRVTDADGNRVLASDESLVPGLDRILSADDAHVARLGYAVSSAPKVAILRILVTMGPQSASQIGERSGLTTGSLYHHLRELTHATVIESTARNRFELTEIGRQTTLLIFAQASRMSSGG